jgi:16S rRNA (guanine(966)-N(2))-methyltransferase RsmD
VNAPRRGAGPPREVRLIGGRFKRSKLPVADRPGLRPTPDRVRETLFNWLGPDLLGWRCLDAFAGSGALGFEAASRGAAEVVMLERDATLAASLRASAQRLGAAAAVRVVTPDALAWMARAAPAQFDLVFIDPPFDAGLHGAALAAAAPLLRAGGVVYLEGPQALEPPPAGWTLYRHTRAGAVHAHLLQAAGYTEPEPPARSAP